MSMGRPRLGAALILTGVVLLGLDVAGLFTTLRNDAIYDERVVNGERYSRPRATYRDVLTLSARELLAAAERRQGETDAAYAARVTLAVHQGIAHYWEPEGIERFHLRIPVYENYLLFAASYFFPKSFREYELYDYRKAIERGVGFCSQQAVILARLLAEGGIETRIVLAPTHTFALALVDRSRGSWWILDSAYGVVIPHGLDDVRRDPASIEPFYTQAGIDAAYVTRYLIPAYGATTFRIVEGAGGYHRLRRFYEPASYTLIWVIPLFLIWSGRRLRRESERAQDA